MKIWKIRLGVCHWEKTVVEMPAGARLLCVSVQDRRPCVWFIVQETAERQVRAFRVVYTGMEITDARAEYVGTAVGEILVWHVFEVTP